MNRIPTIGVDLVSISGFGREMDLGGHELASRLFSDSEIEQSRGSSRQLAKVFGIKEAVMKVLGAGITTVSWTEIEVIGFDHPPRLHGDAADQAGRLGIGNWTISIASAGDFIVATAFAFAERPSNEVPIREET